MRAAIQSYVCRFICSYSAAHQTHYSSSLQTKLQLLKKCTDNKNLNSGKAIHAMLIKRCKLDVVQDNYLINLYARCGQLSNARKVFDEMTEWTVVSVNLLMTGYLHGGFALDALSIFRIVNFGCPDVVFNEYVFTTALASCADECLIGEGRQCHAYVVKSGLMSYLHVKNALIHMYVSCSEVQDAQAVFGMMVVFDVFAFNSMINGFLENGVLDEAKDLLACMSKKMDQWDYVSYVAVLGLCADMRDLNLGAQVHCQILRRGVESSLFVGSAIVDMYGKCSDYSNAWHAFNGLQERNVVSWTSIMAVLAQNGRFEESLKLFLQMLQGGIQPNEYSYAVALSSCAGLSVLENGDALNAHVEKRGFKLYLNIGNALINMYSKSGSIENATKTFKIMPNRDIVSWNSIITAYSNFGFAREALNTFHEMLVEDRIPTYVTFVGVLSACAHLGLVDDGIFYLHHLMRKFGIRPGIEHYTCIVSLLCRAGLLTEAERFMKESCAEWDVVAWRTLLSACGMLKNQGLGYKVAEHIIQLDPDDVGAYILLSNMYAKMNRWDGVAKVRKLMRARDIKKEPGISWIQVGHETHVFSSEDMKHPCSSEIKEKIEELITEIKQIGYVPNLSTVLHDIEDEQKEVHLRYHSEKLAIAFGLIKIPPGGTIHIMKNLRTCDDCHVAIKLISLATNRKIVVRDVNRFHIFQNGVCSCDDYW